MDHQEFFQLLPSAHIISGLVIPGHRRTCEIYNNKVVVWVLKDYGDKKSWRKEWVFNYDGDKKSWSKNPFLLRVPFKVSGYGDGLFVWTASSIFHILWKRNDVVYVYRMKYRTPLYLVKGKGAMDHRNFFEFLPSEIMVDIISRLPIRTILICKCVCKSWLDLLQSPEFVQCHLSKSRARLILQRQSQSCDIYESVGLCNIIPNLPHFKHRSCHINESVGSYNIIPNLHHFKHHTPCEFLDLRIFDPPEFKDLDIFERIKYPYPKIKGSVDGLLIMCHDVLRYRPTIDIVNPTTRECIKINRSQLPELLSGFGVSRKTGEYKVIRIFADKCEVYTLGTGSWRIIPPPVHHLKYISHSFGAFLNGNLHWLVYDFNDRVWISCFDLEYEHFRMFASPPLPSRPRSEHTLSLSTWDGCLWLCDTSSDDKVVIWVLNDYGDEKSWRKEWVFNYCQPKRPRRYRYSNLRRVRFCGRHVEYEDRLEYVDSLTAYSILHCSRKRDGVVCVYEVLNATPTNMVLHNSSFLSLKSFSNEKVILFKN